MSKGLELNAQEKTKLETANDGSADLIMSLYNGRDLVTLPELCPSRWVMNFQSMDESSAKKFPAAFARAERLSKPYRDGLTGQIHEKCHWKFWDYRLRLVEEFAAHDVLLASPLVAKYLCFVRVTTRAVYNMKVKLYFFYEWKFFSVLQSSLHNEWALHWCANIGGTGISYSTTAAFSTWPMPEVHGGDELLLDELGNEYHNHRNSIRGTRHEGLTDIYNRFHDSDEASADIQKLRDLHVEMDHVVTATYGWSDLDLGHGFHETKQGLRYTISELARREVLQRLLKLNHERYEEEVKQGLHDKKRKKTATRKRKGSKKQAATLFDTEGKE